MKEWENVSCVLAVIYHPRGRVLGRKRGWEAREVVSEAGQNHRTLLRQPLGHLRENNWGDMKQIPADSSQLRLI